MNVAEFKKNALISANKTTFSVIGLMYVLVGLIVLVSEGFEGFSQIIPFVSLGFFGVFVLLWGMFIVSSALISEARNKTLVYQKMSAISALEMTIGKFFGSTFYNWILGGVWMLIFIIFAPFTEMPIGYIIDIVFNLILLTLLIHSFTLILTLLLIKRKEGTSDIDNLKSAPMVLFLFFIFSGVVKAVSTFTETSVKWFGFEVDGALFWKMSLLGFTIWSLLGLYRNIRNLLQHKDKPNYWVMFNVFITLFFAGFTLNLAVGNEYDYLNTFFGMAYLVLMVLTMVTLSLEAINIPKYRSLAQSFQKRDWASVYSKMPLWLISMAFAFVVAIPFSLVILSDISAASGKKIYFLMPLVIFLFLFKTMLVRLIINLKEIKKPKLTWFFYLITWFGLIPGLLMASGLGYEALYVFYPVSPVLSGVIGLVYVVVLSVVIRKMLVFEGEG